MAKKASDKTPSGPQLDILTAQKVFGWKNVHKHGSEIIGKKQDKAGRWRSGKVPSYSTDATQAYAIDERMKQLGQSEQYEEELCKITRAADIPLIGLHQINAARLRSKLWDGRARSFIYTNREGRHEYRNGAPCASVVHSNQLRSFVGVVFRLHAGTRLDISASQQMVSSSCGAV
jgi:hypothetical protein